MTRNIKAQSANNSHPLGWQGNDVIKLPRASGLPGDNGYAPIRPIIAPIHAGTW